MADEILKLDSNGDLIAEDPDTGETRPVSFAKLAVTSNFNPNDATIVPTESDVPGEPGWYVTEDKEELHIVTL